MSLYQQIQNDRLSARKEKNVLKSNLLGTVIGDIQTTYVAGKGEVEVSDNEALTIVLRFAENIKDLLKIKEDEKAKQELEVLSSYLPKPLTEIQIKDIVVNINNSLENKKLLMREVMMQFKLNYLGQYNAEDLKKIIQEL